MKFMKKFISWTLAVLFSIAASFAATPRAPTAHAQDLSSAATVGGYACIRSPSVYFYASKNEDSGLFLLPESYFVKILETSDDYCKIEYLYDDAYVKKLVGYARTEQLTFVDFTPKRPYLYHLFPLRYTLDGAIGGDGFLDDLTVTCAYYGDYIVGSKLYCYVLQGESFGYVPKPTDLTYERNTEYAAHVATQTPSDSSENEESSSSSPNAATVAILIALCLLVPILAALILRPPRRPPYETD